MTSSRLTSALALSSAALMLVLSGCGASNTASSSPSTSVSSSVSAASSSVASSQAWKDLVSATGVEITYNADGSRVLTDNGGQKVELPATVGRIANLWDANNQVMLLLGSSDRIVATTQQISKMPWYKKVQPKIAQASTPVSGTDLNVEELLKAKPDVVVSIDKTQVEKARAAGLTTVQLGFQDFAGLKKNVVMTAEVLGTDQARSQAIKYITYLEKNL
ncbi:MAG: ABC transporter substrate-binding protein, partial [Rothia mucilaginosa]